MRTMSNDVVVRGWLYGVKTSRKEVFHSLFVHTYDTCLPTNIKDSVTPNSLCFEHRGLKTE